MKTTHPTPEEREKIRSEIAKRILLGDYRSALPIAASARKRFPTNVFCRYQYAKILGDWADELPAARRRKLKREAVEILKPLLRALGGENAKTRFGICLNYYYQAENFAGMVRFGRRLAARRDRQGFYAIGIGSSLEAKRRHGMGDGRALGWAKKSLAAWKRYGLSQEKYYFPHYIEAMAFAVLGERQDGLRSLSRAARLSRRNVKDWEFSDVYALLAKKGHPG